MTTGHDMGGNYERFGYDLAIALRVCDKICSKAPKNYPAKFDLVKDAFSSLKPACEGLRVFLFVLDDSLSQAYESMFLSLWGEGITILTNDGLSNAGSLHAQIAVLCEQDKSEFVYALEDDYLHTCQLSSPLALVRRHNCFVCPSPNMTFMCRRDTLLKHRPVFDAKTDSVSDRQIWGKVSATNLCLMMTTMGVHLSQ